MNIVSQRIAISRHRFINYVEEYDEEPTKIYK